MRRAVLLLAILAAHPAQAKEVQFCWEGNAGYRLVGTMAFPDLLSTADLITEADVTAFTITGYWEDATVGHWSLDQLTPQTSWNLNYSPRDMQFLVGGHSTGDSGQQWNADGTATNCGLPGLGFNSGASAQDLCLDGVFVQESGVDPATPLMAVPAEAASPCEGELQLSLAGGQAGLVATP
jgi:hypothetical protein